MSIATEEHGSAATAGTRTSDLKLEVVTIPVSDTDRAKRFYGSLGWRLDAELATGNGFRVVQFTPPGSACSIHFGSGVTQAEPGTAQGLFLAVTDVEAARAELAERGVDVSAVFHRQPGADPIAGLEPARRTYASYASFRDPDGNSWLLQEVTARLPGRVDGSDATFSSPADLAAALRRAAFAHGEHEARNGGARDEGWPDWYATYLVAEQHGERA